MKRPANNIQKLGIKKTRLGSMSVMAVGSCSQHLQATRWHYCILRTWSNDHRVGGHLVERLFMDGNICISTAISRCCTICASLVEKADKRDKYFHSCYVPVCLFTQYNVNNSLTEPIYRVKLFYINSKAMFD